MDYQWRDGAPLARVAALLWHWRLHRPSPMTSQVVVAAVVAAAVEAQSEAVAAAALEAQSEAVAAAVVVVVAAAQAATRVMRTAAQMTP